MTKPFVYLFTLAILALTIIACAPAAPTATPAPTPTATPAPTATAIPTPTPQPTPTAKPWVTFSPRPYFSIQLPSGAWEEAMNETGAPEDVIQSTVAYRSPTKRPYAVVMLITRGNLPQVITADLLLQADLKVLQKFPGLREVSKKKVSPDILRTHFKHDADGCFGSYDTFGLHILTEVRTYTVLANICDEDQALYDADFVERVFDGFSYE